MTIAIIEMIAVADASRLLQLPVDAAGCLK